MVYFSGRVYNERGYEPMEYFEELELRFGNFKDLAESYPIWHGKHDDEEPELDNAVGYFKVGGDYNSEYLFFVLLGYFGRRKYGRFYVVVLIQIRRKLAIMNF